MLAIRLQRLGRKALPIYRLAVQESQRHPSSGRVVAYVGSYNPHTKETRIDTEKVAFYLGNGAQPTPRVVRILSEQKVDLPAWVKQPASKEGKLRNPEKLRKNRPADEAPAEEPAEEAVEPTEAPAETEAEAPAEEATNE
ncbi:MAG TPA: 30S ribosomal protein S16 [Candidatus Saccharibacteria bacterium]|nr:30S ribosomal protein S16 [Candidatus Saccharibacteria bacterium]